MSSSERTPGPWHVGPYYKSDIESAQGRIAECGIARGPRADIDAAFIVRACNSHDALLSALKWAQSVMVRHKSFCPANEERGVCNCGMQRIHDAIKAAEAL